MTSNQMSSSLPASTHLGPTGGFIVGISLVIAATVMMAGTVPTWIQPSAVGAMFGGLFLLGLVLGGVGRGSLMFALATLVCWLLIQSSIVRITSLNSAEVLLITTCLLALGWITALLESLTSDVLGRNPTLVQYRQWTMWDIGLLTLWAAVCCHCIQRLESPVYLLVEVGYVLAGGAVASWIAYRWAFDDRWSISKFAGLLAIGVFVLWMISCSTPFNSSASEVILWMITGPIAVISTQGLLVLATLSIIRMGKNVEQLSSTAFCVTSQLTKQARVEIQTNVPLKICDLSRPDK